MSETINNKLHHILRETFKFETFRPGQLEVIKSLLKSNRLLAIQPTGYGKSLLYQLPAVYLGGVTLVISPLLALIRDQINQLKNRFDILAGTINTDQTLQENLSTKRALASGKMQIVFIAPEQLENRDQFAFFCSLPINLLVIDEAHCISVWGHDFRPSYRQIIQLVNALNKKNKKIKLLALTATANIETEKDITEQISHRKKVVIFRESMDKPNLKLSVIHIRGIASKLATLKSILKSLSGCGVIYCSTRENTEVVYHYLQEQQINAAAYHAGLPLAMKLSIQQQFLESDNLIIAATNALGMGIDKPNLRFVIHFDFPGSLTAYYQEVGRAGRDGLPAEGILFYDPKDEKIHHYFIQIGQPTENDFGKVIHAIQSASDLATLQTIRQNTGINPTKINVIVSELIEQGVIEKKSQKYTYLYVLRNQMASCDLTRSNQKFKAKYAELQKIQFYAEQTRQCLMSLLRLAVGDKAAENCGRCSICTKINYTADEDKSTLLSLSLWLTHRVVTIQHSEQNDTVLPAIAILDSRRRAQDVASFVGSRTELDSQTYGLSQRLLQLIKDTLNELNKIHHFSSIVILPSVSWKNRDAIGIFISKFLNIPVLLNLLGWKDTSDSIQTKEMELLNKKSFPKGTLLLIDDYIASGRTLKEALLILRDKGNVMNKVLPFFIAAMSSNSMSKSI